MGQSMSRKSVWIMRLVQLLAEWLQCCCVERLCWLGLQEAAACLGLCAAAHAPCDGMEPKRCWPFWLCTWLALILCCLSVLAAVLVVTCQCRWCRRRGCWCIAGLFLGYVVVVDSCHERTVLVFKIINNCVGSRSLHPQHASC